MSKFGLTEAQRKTEPWGLPAELLEPAKTITDPVHGDIYISKLELLILDSPPMQRLRRIRQLGTTHLVYPGATHTRLSHSLGALRTAQNLLDAVIDHANLPNATPDLISEWRSNGHDGERSIAEAIVLARLGALLHDMCHIPYGHSIEDDLGILIPHDENEKRFELLWQELEKSLLASKDFIKLTTSIGDDLTEALRPLILSKEENIYESTQRYPFVADIVGNTICADLIDYLQRDHLYTGLPARLGHRFIEGFYVTRSDNRYRKKRMVVQISRDGRQRTDVISEMLKYLRYRYELSERVIVHHAKVAADVMVGKLLALWLEYLKSTGSKESPVDLLEQHMTRFGDDGLLEYIRITVETGKKSYPHCDAILDICTALLNRSLYKLIGHSRQFPIAEEVYSQYGKAEHRRDLEAESASFADLDSTWHVLLWVPSPAMKLKGADVLVEDNGRISKLSSMGVVGRGAGGEIQKDHRALWTLGVYIHPSLRDNEPVCGRILAYIRDKLPGVEWNEYQKQPDIDQLICHAAAIQLGLRVGEDANLIKLNQGIAAYGGTGEFDSRVQQLADAYENTEVADQKELELK